MGATVSWAAAIFLPECRRVFEVQRALWEWALHVFDEASERFWQLSLIPGARPIRELEMDLLSVQLKLFRWVGRANA